MENLDTLEIFWYYQIKRERRKEAVMKERKDKLFYSPEEFRHILGCSRHLCYEALRTRRIRSFRLGKKYFIPASEADRLGQVSDEGTGNTNSSDIF